MRLTEPLKCRPVLALRRTKLLPAMTREKSLSADRLFPRPRGKADELRALLTQQQETRPAGCPWVFHRNGRRIKCLKETWSRACQAAGLHGKVPLDLRRSAVRNLVRAGIPERIAMQVTGHADRSVFERYNIVSPGDLQQVAQVLNVVQRQDTLANNYKNNYNRPSFQSVRTLSA